MELIERDSDDELDAAVRTLAEFIYECGFTEERALDMSWELALLPKRMKEERVEWMR